MTESYKIIDHNYGAEFDHGRSGRSANVIAQWHGA